MKAHRKTSIIFLWALSLSNITKDIAVNGVSHQNSAKLRDSLMPVGVNRPHGYFHH